MFFTQIITSKTDTLTFGKYKGQSIREVLRIRPSYILWLHEKGICQFPEDIIIEAEDFHLDALHPHGLTSGWGDREEW